jgi:hypothetical protein
MNFESKKFIGYEVPSDNSPESLKQKVNGFINK